ncbi:MAG: hypothetical protein COB85_04075 [Bacteroidetes bacterium]|nr:MAG: hypothetical protein COB85_04075 [Bacteroidota bacterium]
MDVNEIKYDCKYFKGFMPCEPSKKDGSICDTCTHYTPVSKKILIIKLGAIGDVIRTTPLLQKYRTLYPDCHITWVTQFPEVLPEQSIDKLYKLDSVSLFILTNESFDIAINLDKDKEACVLLANTNADEKYGWTYANDHIAPATKNAEHKLITGLFDSISQENTKSYLEEIFEICHQKFNYEEYVIKVNTDLSEKWKRDIVEKSNGKKIIGLNTGCGPRWKTRLWPEDYWIEMISELEGKGYFCMLLGGPAEDEQNKIYAKETNSYYPGHYSLEEFISITNACDVIVTQVSLMMHVAIALQKQMVLFNNIFNPHEFELYGRGVIMGPSSGCDCFYGTSCSRERSCMQDISVADVVKNIQKLSQSS